MVHVKSAKELKDMMKACELSAQVLELAGTTIKAGMSTYELDCILHDFIVRHGGTPSFLGLYGFKGSACISINEELIHGIPSKKKIIKEGDIVSVDIGACLNGWHGDNTKTFIVGDVAAETKRLLQVTEESLYQGIKMAVAGNRIGDISNAIQSYCESNGFFVVKPYIGHGVGRDIHEDPEVPNYGRPGRGPRLVPGMVLAIEPMINSTTEQVRVLDDKWTVVEANGNMSAHFEHTIAVTNSEPIIMTLSQH